MLITMDKHSYWITSSNQTVRIYQIRFGPNLSSLWKNALDLKQVDLVIL